MKYRWASLFFLLSAAAVVAREPVEPLGSIRSVKVLPPKTAEQQLPLVLEAQAVQVDHLHSNCFLFDGKYGIYASVRAGSGLLDEVRAGDILRVQGITDPGDFSPCIKAADIEVIGRKPLPEGRAFSAADYSSVAFDCDWVKLKGRLTAVVGYPEQAQNSILVTLEHNNISYQFRIPYHAAYLKQFRALLFEWVEVSAVAGVVSNSQRQFVSRIFFANAPEEFVRIESGPRQAEIPELPIHQLQRIGEDTRKVVRTRGIVTRDYYEEVFIRGEAGCLRVIKPRMEWFAVGREIALEGIVDPRPVSPAFRYRSVEIMGLRDEPVPLRIDLRDGKPDARLNYDLVEIEAELVEVWTTAPFGEAQDLVLLCRSGDTLFEARYLQGYGKGIELEVGSILKLTGICHLVRGEAFPWVMYSDSMWIRIQFEEDIQILHEPPWWTARRLIWAGGFLLGIAMVFLVSTVVLRSVVAKQSGIIREKVEREAVYDERQRIARELHDNLAQGLVGMASYLRSCFRIVELGAQKITGLLETSKSTGDIEPVLDGISAHVEQSHDYLRQLQGMLDACSEESRSSILYLRSGMAGRMGLLAALEEVLEPLAADAGVLLEIQVDGAAQPLPMEEERNLMLVVKEAVANAIRHGKPASIAVRMGYSEQGLEILVKDNGCGFEPDVPPEKGHYGIKGMRERMAQLGGHLAVSSAPGKGTEITVYLPMDRSRKDEHE